MSNNTIYYERMAFAVHMIFAWRINRADECARRSHIAFSRNWVTLLCNGFVFFAATHTVHLPVNVNQNIYGK